MDDALSGQTIYGNLLVNVPSIALHLGGGRDLQVYNNLVINTNDSSISYDDRARDGIFEDAANGNYTLKNAPDGFEQIPSDKIGRY